MVFLGKIFMYVCERCDSFFSSSLSETLCIGQLSNDCLLFMAVNTHCPHTFFWTFHFPLFCYCFQIDVNMDAQKKFIHIQARLTHKQNILMTREPMREWERKKNVNFPSELI